MTTVISRDIIILGGGIAGLWLLNRLRLAGYDALLLESDELGCGQTIASQGMIHGGVKYTLGGNLTRASTSIADMPTLWKRCIAGEGDVDLRGCRVLSQRYFMWPRNNMRSRLTAFLGSKALRGRVTPLSLEQYPLFFRDHIQGPLYELNDMVLDVPSLLDTLSTPQRDRIHRIDWSGSRLLRAPSGDVAGISTRHDGQALELRARRYILAGGAGNAPLLEDNTLTGPAMQRRPLHMVLVRHQHRDPLYVHCVADRFSSTPELTITTHFRADGDPVWYLGGELAESGVEHDAEAQIDRARSRLKTLFPWCDLDAAQWASFHINRAEPRQPGGHRPDNAFCEAQHNYPVCWPTKLTLAPALANQVMDSLARASILPENPHGEPLPLPFPGVATAPWERLFA